MNCDVEIILWIIYLSVPTSRGGWNITVTPDQTCGRCTTKQTGGDITFTCATTPDDATGHIRTGIEFQWLHNDKLITSDMTSERLYTYQPTWNQASLFISQIQQSDAGQYACVVRLVEDGATMKKSTSLLVLIVPVIQFIDTPATQYFPPKADAHVHCHVYGQPQAVITWLHGDLILQAGDKYSFSPDGLIIHEMTEQDDGVYTCRVNIAFHNTPGYKEINVLTKRPPKFNKPLNDVTGATGELTIRCQADGKPPPQYHWLKQHRDKQVTLDNATKYTINSKTGELTIRNLTMVDEGSYMCIATSDAGSVVRTVDVSNIIERPNIAVDGSGLVHETETLELTCQGNGHPIPRVSWEIYGPESAWTSLPEIFHRTSSISGKKFENRLQIHNVTYDHAGRYRCVVMYHDTYIREEINVKVIANSPKPLATEEEPVVKASGWQAFHIVLLTCSILLCVVIILVLIYCIKWRKGRCRQNTDDCKNKDAPVNAAEVTKLNAEELPDTATDPT